MISEIFQKCLDIIKRERIKASTLVYLKGENKTKTKKYIEKSYMMDLKEIHINKN